MALLRQRGRLLDRTLQVPLQRDAEPLAARTEALIAGQPLAVDAAGHGLVWSGVSEATASPAAAPSALEPLPPTPLASTPPSLDDADDRRNGKTCGQSGYVVSRRTSRVRSGRRGDNARASRVTQREQARLPTPVRTGNSPTVTTALGQRCAAGGVEMAPICASTTEHKAVSNSTVIMLRSSHGQDGTFPAWQRRLTTARPHNVS
jgi:hypothetical protein